MTNVIVSGVLSRVSFDDLQKNDLNFFFVPKKCVYVAQFGKLHFRKILNNYAKNKFKPETKETFLFFTENG